jgi:hypothetical protein
MNGEATAGAEPDGDETRVSDQQNAELLGVSVVLDLFVPLAGSLCNIPWCETSGSCAQCWIDGAKNISIGYKPSPGESPLGIGARSMWLLTSNRAIYGFLADGSWFNLGCGFFYPRWS